MQYQSFIVRITGTWWIIMKKNNHIFTIKWGSQSHHLRITLILQFNDKFSILQGFVLSMNKQLLNHQITVVRIKNILTRDGKSTNGYLNKCLYTVGMGNNDYINNYFLPKFYPTSRIYTPEQYATVLIQQYSQQLKVISFPLLPFCKFT